MRSKPDIKMGQLCMLGEGGGAVLGIVGGGVTFCFLNGDAIPDKNMPFFVSSCGSLENLPDFKL